MKLNWEKWLPFILFFATSGVVFHYFAKITFVTRLRPLAEPIINLSAISIGFLATVKTVMISIEDRYIVKQMKKAGVYRRLMNHLIRSIWLCMGLALASVATILVDPNDKSTIDRFTVSVWIGLAVASAFSCCAVVQSFCKIVTFGDSNR